MTSYDDIHRSVGGGDQTKAFFDLGNHSIYLSISTFGVCGFVVLARAPFKSLSTFICWDIIKQLVFLNSMSLFSDSTYSKLTNLVDIYVAASVGDKRRDWSGCYLGLCRAASSSGGDGSTCHSLQLGPGWQT